MRIWSDGEGESHFDDVSLPTSTPPRETGVPELVVSDAVEVSGVEFLEVRTGSFQPDWHPAPRRQFVVFLTGWVRLEVSDGEVRTLPAGSTVLVEDLTGKGHVTTHEPGDQRVLVLALVEPG